MSFFNRLRGKGRGKPPEAASPTPASPANPAQPTGPPSPSVAPAPKPARQRSGQSGQSPSVSVDLPSVIAALEQHLTVLEKKKIVPALVQARLADWLRATRLDPPPPAQVEAWVEGFDEEGWRRLALLVSALEGEAMRAALVSLATRDDVASFVRAGLVGTAARMHLHPLSLLRESSVRLEELARVWLLDLEADIVGESEAQSAKRLTRINYGRLLSEAERAKLAAEARMAELRKEQEKADRARAGRSKW